MRYVLSQRLIVAHRMSPDPAVVAAYEREKAYRRQCSSAVAHYLGRGSLNSCVIDVEPVAGRIYELGLTKLGAGASVRCVVNPGVEILTLRPNPFSSRAARTEIARDAPSFSAIATRIAEAIGRARHMFGWNVGGDRNALRGEFGRIGASMPSLIWLDTMKLFCLAAKLDRSQTSLERAVNEIYLPARGVTGGVWKQRHRALADAEVTAELTMWSLRQLYAAGVDHNDIPTEAGFLGQGWRNLPAPVEGRRDHVRRDGSSVLDHLHLGLFPEPETVATSREDFEAKRDRMIRSQ